MRDKAEDLKPFDVYINDAGGISIYVGELLWSGKFDPETEKRLTLSSMRMTERITFHQGGDTVKILGNLRPTLEALAEEHHE
jgi:hypothetical protein